MTFSIKKQDKGDALCSALMSVVLVNEDYLKRAHCFVYVVWPTAVTGVVGSVRLTTRTVTNSQRLQHPISTWCFTSPLGCHTRSACLIAGESTRKVA